jgi:hypothetical protein
LFCIFVQRFVLVGCRTLEEAKQNKANWSKQNWGKPALLILSSHYFIQKYISFVESFKAGVAHFLQWKYFLIFYFDVIDADRTEDGKQLS